MLANSTHDSAKDDSSVLKETNTCQLEKLLCNDAIHLDLVSAFAGDRPLSESEETLLAELKISHGQCFYSDLLYSVTHQSFPPEDAEEVWNKILRHKYSMSVLMKRNIRITVASLDYLSNLTSELEGATVIGEEQITDIVQLTLHDGLTGLFNHAYCFQTIGVELARYTRYKTLVSLMMIDIDDFKELNDRDGHQEGDRILALIGSIIKTTARELDVCCRYGGEEFALILPSTDATEAGVLAERLRTEIASRLQGVLPVTVSIGVASCGKEIRTPQTFVKKADDALYQAKRNGKNQVVVSA
ncbi:MAG: GGDEF domain-containing protein [Fibrobacterota bacterium]